MAILTVSNDLHALAIQKRLSLDGDVQCLVVETDKICASGGLSWDSENSSSAVLPGRNGEPVLVDQLALVWWRRVNGPQLIPIDITDPVQIDVVNNDCRYGLTGALTSAFRGTWISDPVATVNAENKITQLKAAKLAGFRVPRTLVSQDPAKIRKFCQECDCGAIVKPIKGTVKQHLFTQPVTPNHLISDASLALAPAIYQEFVPGHRHLRVNCFGERIETALLYSEELDWRGNLNIPVEAWKLEAAIEDKVRAVLRLLNLRMGIFDFKLLDDGSVVWLEANPQGQFLFLEPLAGIDMTSLAADFFRRSALAAIRDAA